MAYVMRMKWKVKGKKGSKTLRPHMRMRPPELHSPNMICRSDLLLRDISCFGENHNVLKRLSVQHRGGSAVWNNSLEKL